MDSIVPAAALSVASLVSNVLSSAKAAKEPAKQSGDAALKEQIGDLIDSIIDVKQRVIELDEENRELRKKLEAKAELKWDTKLKLYLAEGDPDPFCTPCWDSKRNQIRVHPTYYTGGDGILWKYTCNVCRSVFVVAD
jgi:hypothetical protein